MQTLVLQTERKTQLTDITASVREAVAGVAGAAVVIFIPHTTAGVLLQASGEGATEVAADIEAAFERLVDESWSGSTPRRATATPGPTSAPPSPHPH
jgi:thiamine phosphate synthase YjbQ (UPF0047 family)